MNTQPIPPLTGNTHFLMFSFDLDSGRINYGNPLFRQQFKFLSLNPFISLYEHPSVITFICVGDMARKAQPIPLRFTSVGVLLEHKESE